MTRRIRIRILLAAATTAALVGAAGPATAAGLGAAEDLRYRTSSTTLPAGTSGEPTTTEVYTNCDKGWRAVAGGQVLKGGVERGISTTAPSGMRYWFTSAWQRANVTSPLTQYVVCLRIDTFELNTEVQDDLAPDSAVVGDVTCTQGYAVSGGMTGVSDSYADYSLNASYPFDDASDTDSVPDDGWRVYGNYYGSGGDGVRTHGVCLPGTRPAYRSATVTVPALKSVTAQALCPRTRPTVGGGVYVNGATTKSHVIASRPWDNGDAGSVPEDGWRATVTNDSGEALTMTVHAVCR